MYAQQLFIGVGISETAGSGTVSREEPIWVRQSTVLGMESSGRFQNGRNGENGVPNREVAPATQTRNPPALQIKRSDAWRSVDANQCQARFQNGQNGENRVPKRIATVAASAVGLCPIETLRAARRFKSGKTDEFKCRRLWRDQLALSAARAVPGGSASGVPP